MSTYSVRFMHHSAAGVWQYTVPSQKRAVVKAVNAITNSFATDDRGWELTIAGMYAAAFYFPAGIAGNSYELRCIAYAGETITLIMHGSAIHCHVSGYLLDAPGDSGAAGKPIEPEREGLPRPSPTSLAA